MPLQAPFKCWRGRDDCYSMASVEATPENLTEEQYATLNFTPVSFVCCGCIKPDARQIPQDAYRICFKNDAGDEMTDNDDQDIAHLSYVLAQAQGIIATRRVNQGEIDTLDPDGDMLRVKTMQGAKEAN